MGDSGDTITLAKCAVFLLALLCFSAQANEPARVVVNTQKQTLTVFNGSESVAVFKDIAIGRNGTTYSKHHLDNKTPLGTFRVAYINRDSKFHLFFGFNYPTRAHAARALAHDRISADMYWAIVLAQGADELPPQRTPLGGYLGIHGLGEGSLTLHRRLNWTQGCIALTNKQIETLDHWVELGTVVVVR